MEGHFKFLIRESKSRPSSFLSEMPLPCQLHKCPMTFDGWESAGGGIRLLTTSTKRKRKCILLRTRGSYVHCAQVPETRLHMGRHIYTCAPNFFFQTTRLRVFLQMHNRKCCLCTAVTFAQLQPCHRYARPRLEKGETFSLFKTLKTSSFGSCVKSFIGKLVQNRKVSFC